ncbi:hypothetical protein KBY93_12465 [Synechococcus sp. J7-Johnson]|nr:hypothetical protein [Synechococcus sp. J7-Johnson]
MALFHLFIERQTHPGGGAFSHIRPQIAGSSHPNRELLAWLCFCPESALQVSRIGPVWFAHGGEWARVRDLESFHWPHLGGTRIHGKGVAMKREGYGRWAAFSEAEAYRWQSVLWRHCGEIQGTSCPVHQAFEGQLPWDELVSFRASEDAAKFAIRQRVQAGREAARAI